MIKPPLLIIVVLIAGPELAQAALQASVGIVTIITTNTTNTTITFMVTQHIPTMTKSHHGGEMSVMIKVGMCQCQKPTIHPYTMINYILEYIRY